MTNYGLLSSPKLQKTRNSKLIRPGAVIGNRRARSGGGPGWAVEAVCVFQVRRLGCHAMSCIYFKGLQELADLRLVALGLASDHLMTGADVMQQTCL